MKIHRKWAMPNRHTFEVRPIGDFVRRYLASAKVSVDMFSGRTKIATFNNDLAFGGVDAELFLKNLAAEGKKADLVIFDPPYSPRQISECYKACGMAVGSKETQNAALYSRVKKAIRPILNPGGIVLSFGWNSTGMGKDFKMLEILLCAHGAAHNDTICVAEQLLVVKR